jgi:hypothetical protein
MRNIEIVLINFTALPLRGGVRGLLALKEVKRIKEW